MLKSFWELMKCGMSFLPFVFGEFGIGEMIMHLPIKDLDSRVFVVFCYL